MLNIKLNLIILESSLGLLYIVPRPNFFFAILVEPEAQ